MNPSLKGKNQKMNTYTSSIIFKFGDTDNVKKDSLTLREILSRQGTSLIIDVLADVTAESIDRVNTTKIERQRLVNSILTELQNALDERI